MLIIVLAGCNKHLPTLSSHSKYKETTFSGIRILQQERKSDWVHFVFVLKGGTSNYRPGKAGIEALAFETLLHDNSKDYNYLKRDSLLSSLKARLSIYYGTHFAAIHLTCPEPNQRDCLSPFLDLILHPQFRPGAFEQARETITSRLDKAQHPDWYEMSKTAHRTYFEESPYGTDPNGNLRNIGRLTLRETKAYFKTQVTKQKCALVVTGPVDEEQLMDQLLYSLADLPEGNAEQETPDFTPSDQSSFQTTGSYEDSHRLFCLFNAPEITDQKSLAAMQLAMAALEKRLQDSLDGMHSFLNTTLYLKSKPYCEIALESNYPNECAEKIIQVLHKTTGEGFSEAELQRVKNMVITDFYVARDKGELDAHLFAEAFVNGVPNITELYPEMVSSLKTKQVNKTFRSYCRALTWVHFGDREVPKNSYYLKPIDED